MNILISGGAGFIGVNLAHKLKQKGYRITLFDNLSPQIHGLDPINSTFFKTLKSQFNFIIGDVRNREDWLEAIENQNYIIHLAAETGTGQSMYEIEKYCQVNVSGTAILWDILANSKHSVVKVIVASSRAIYGEGRYNCFNHGIVFPENRLEADLSVGDFNVKCPICKQNVDLMSTTEDSLIHPTSVYGFTKQAQEELSLIAGKSINIPVVAFRYQNVYGPGQSLSNPYTGILSIFSTRIKNGNDITIFEDGKESRDFIYIDDVVDATILGLEKEEANFNSFNVGTGLRIDVLTVAELLKEKYKSDIKIIVTGNYRLGDIRDNYADLNKIKSKLGFSPKILFNEGISNFVEWVNEQEVQKDKFEDSIHEMKSKGLYK